MTAAIILLIVVMFSGSILFCYVTNCFSCCEEELTHRPAEALQNKETTDVFNNVVVIEKI